MFLGLKLSLLRTGLGLVSMLWTRFIFEVDLIYLLGLLLSWVNMTRFIEVGLLLFSSGVKSSVWFCMLKAELLLSSPSVTIGFLACLKEVERDYVSVVWSWVSLNDLLCAFRIVWLWLAPRLIFTRDDYVSPPPCDLSTLSAECCLDLPVYSQSFTLYILIWGLWLYFLFAST